MSEREQKVKLIQDRLMKNIKETKMNGELRVRISDEDAINIVFLLDIIRVTVRKMDEIIK